VQSTFQIIEAVLRVNGRLNTSCVTDKKKKADGGWVLLALLKNFTLAINTFMVPTLFGLVSKGYESF